MPSLGKIASGLGRALLSSAFLLSFAVCLRAQNKVQPRGVPYDPDFGPGFHKVVVELEYPGTYPRIEAVDFRDLSLLIVDEHKSVLAKANLKNGMWEQRNECWQKVKLDSVHFLTAQDSDRRFALALYTWSQACGSSNTDGVAQVYEIRNGQLKSVQQLGWDEHFDTDHAYAYFNEKSQTLQVRAAHYLPGDSHCCASAMDVITLTWNGNSFTKKTVRVELSKSGEKEGKRL